MGYRVTLIPGDGVGPEVTAAAVRVIEATGVDVRWDCHDAGAGAAERRGHPLPDPAIASIRGTGVALKGPLETPVGGGFRSANVALRQTFDLYANVRPVRTILPFRSYDAIDLVMIRENTEGLYVGVEHFVRVGDDPRAVAESTAVITRKGCERIIRFAFEYAVTHRRRKVTMVHKANILKTGGSLWLDTGREIAAAYDGRVAFEDRIIDNTAMQLVIRPEQFDVLVTANMFGDILSDEMAGLVGGLGLAASANLGAGVAIFEAVHGTAPDIAGRGVVNPSALILAGAMMLDHLGETGAGTRVREAVTKSIRDDGVRTRDLGGTADTAAFTDHLVELLRRN